MKSFHYRNTRADLIKQINANLNLVLEIDINIKRTYNEISVSRDSWKETQFKIDLIKEMQAERNKYEKKVKELNEQLKQTV